MMLYSRYNFFVIYLRRSKALLVEPRVTRTLGGVVITSCGDELDTLDVLDSGVSGNMRAGTLGVILRRDLRVTFGAFVSAVNTDSPSINCGVLGGDNE